tara:strand:- start:323 stop:454 length:132 start_codon:yes stop_codon:yes gene_type:complete
MHQVLEREQMLEAFQPAEFKEGELLFKQGKYQYSRSKYSHGEY